MYVILPLDGDRKPTLFLGTPFNETGAAFSPDGRWIAYTSVETGRNALYVHTFPGSGEKEQVSTGGGGGPGWPADGKELYYSAGRAIMAVPVDLGGAFKAGKPRALLTAPTGLDVFANSVTGDGSRFLALQSGETDTTQLNLSLNWLDDLKSRTTAQK